MANSNRDRAVGLLDHYVTLLMTQAKLKVSEDTHAELVDLVDSIIDAATATGLNAPPPIRSRGGFRFNNAAALDFDKRTAYHIAGDSLLATMRQGGYDRMEVTQTKDGEVSVRYGWREDGQ